MYALLVTFARICSNQTHPSSQEKKKKVAVAVTSVLFIASTLRFEFYSIYLIVKTENKASNKKVSKIT